VAAGGCLAWSRFFKKEDKLTPKEVKAAHRILEPVQGGLSDALPSVEVTYTSTSSRTSRKQVRRMVEGAFVRRRALAAGAAFEDPGWGMAELRHRWASRAPVPTRIHHGSGELDPQLMSRTAAALGYMWGVALEDIADWFDAYRLTGASAGEVALSGERVHDLRNSCLRKRPHERHCEGGESQRKPRTWNWSASVARGARLGLDSVRSFRLVASR